MIASPPIRNNAEPTSEPTPGSAQAQLGQRALRLVPRLLLFGGLWLVIADNVTSSWIIGLPTVMLASIGSLRLARSRATPARLSVFGLLRFLPFFIAESVRGGVDVAYRVLRPRLKINPGFRTYRPRLAHPAARVLFLDSISLLPGTLSADLRDGLIEVHALDLGTDLLPDLQRLERRVGRIFGESLEDTANDHLKDQLKGHLEEDHR
jgi:multicomponent Na+:H+ antiporter subunit E